MGEDKPLHKSAGSERKKALEKLVFEHEFSNALLENVEAGVVVCDAKGQLVFFNRLARDWHGLDPTKIPQGEWARYYDLYLEDGVTPMDINTIPLARAFRGEVVRDVGMVIAAKGKPKRQIIANGTSIRDADGKIIGAIGVMLDITARKKAEEETRLNSEIMQNISEGVILIRAGDGEILQTNPKFDEMFGYQSGELSGKNISAINAPKDEELPEQIADRIVASLAATGKWSGEVYNRKKDGSFFWCYANVSAFNHPDYGKLWVSIHTDINERKQLDKMRNNFIRDASHGLVTPMAMAEMAFNMYREGKRLNDSARMDKAERIISNNIVRLRRDISNLLEIFALDIKKTAKKKEVFLKTVVDNILDGIKYITVEKNLKFEIDIPQEASVIYADERDVQTLMDNLINNAMKFTKNGNITISARLNNECIELRVSDTGQGIAAEEIGKVFEKFYRKNPAIPGIGLGLPICKEIVNMHGGKIRIISEGEGKGATVVVQLPKGDLR